MLTGQRMVTAAGLPTIGGCQIFPADNVWNTRIDTLPVHARSDAWVNSIGRTTGLHPDFWSGLWEGSPIGIPYGTAPGTQPAVNISFHYDDQSDVGAYRIPPDALVEGGSDNHVLVVDHDRCLLTEVFDATKISNTTWEAGSGAFFDLHSNALRPNTWLVVEDDCGDWSTFAGGRRGGVLAPTYRPGQPMSLSYSSWVPIQNQTNPSGFSTATAR